MNIIPCHHSGPDHIRFGQIEIGLPAPLGERVARIGLRPEDLHLTSPDAGQLRGTVAQIEEMRTHLYVHVDVPLLARLVVRAAKANAPAPGTPVGLSFSAEDCCFFANSGEELTIPARAITRGDHPSTPPEAPTLTSD